MPTSCSPILFLLLKLLLHTYTVLSTLNDVCSYWLDGVSERFLNEVKRNPTQMKVDIPLAHRWLGVAAADAAVVVAGKDRTSSHRM